MTSPIDVAMTRLAALQEEMAELQTFIRVYYRLYPKEKLAEVLPNGPSLKTAFRPVEKSVDNPVEKVSGRDSNDEDDVLDTASETHVSDQDGTKAKLKNAKEIFGDLFEHLIAQAGRPLTRGDMLTEIEAMPDGPPLNSEDNSKYLGTLLWRNRHRFRNLPGHGYWLKDAPYAPAGYDPATDTDHKRMMEMEAGFAEQPEKETLLERYDREQREAS